jgi:uncharacterized membrane protein HdeD (DUF308 family)
MNAAKARDVPGSSLLILRGIIGIVIGVLAFAWPGVTVAVLISIFAIYAIVDGVINLFLGLSRQGRSWAHLLQGLVGLGAGVLTFMWPTITLIVLLSMIAAWAVITGVLEIAAAIRLRKVIRGEWLLMLSGVLSILFGIFVIAYPGAGAVSIAWVLGVYAAAAGITLVVLGIKLRSRSIGFARPAHA